MFANWLHDVLRDQFDIDLNKLSIDQQQLIAQVALGLASSMENAGGKAEFEIIYIKNFFRQKFTKEQIESFNKLQDYLDIYKAQRALLKLILFFTSNSM